MASGSLLCPGRLVIRVTDPLVGVVTNKLSKIAQAKNDILFKFVIAEK